MRRRDGRATEVTDRNCAFCVEDCIGEHCEGGPLCRVHFPLGAHREKDGLCLWYVWVGYGAALRVEGLLSRHTSSSFRLGS